MSGRSWLYRLARRLDLRRSVKLTLLNLLTLPGVLLALLLIG